jgi:uncharacterized protein YwgA
MRRKPNNTKGIIAYKTKSKLGVGMAVGVGRTPRAERRQRTKRLSDKLLVFGKPTYLAEHDGALMLAKEINEKFEKLGFEDKVSNRLLLLYLIHKANAKGFKQGKTKLQKYIFVAEAIMNEAKVKCFNYNIMMWNYGPYSVELSQDADFLQENNLLGHSTIELTGEGEQFIQKFGPIIERNRGITKTIDQIVDKITTLSLSSLLKFVYEHEHILPDGRKLKIKNVPMGSLLLHKLSPKEAKHKFELTEDEMDDLDLLMNQNAKKKLTEALNMRADIPITI